MENTKQIERCYLPPRVSFFLFGPRGVGKSTWIKQQLKPALVVDLLEQRTFLELQRDATLLESKINHLPEGSLVLVDEIQKLPELLNEVHRILEDKKLVFALTGSSTRKLKSSGVNLLAGRALTRKMFPFSFCETKENFTLEHLLTYGSLPIVLKDRLLCEDILPSYVFTYLQEEIKEEALVRRVEEFSRFLQLSAQLNGNVLSLEKISREAGKSAKTIQSWYHILEDTLLVHKVEPYRPGFKVRESAHPKYYWFDCGVARVAAGLSVKDVDGFWNGFAFETMVLRELLTAFEVLGEKFKIYYYSNSGTGAHSNEIDFLIETRVKTFNRPSEFVTLEVKISSKWKSEYETPSRLLKKVAGEGHKKMLGVYTGKERLTFTDFDVYPFEEFVKELYAGKLI